MILLLQIYNELETIKIKRSYNLLCSYLINIIISIWLIIISYIIQNGISII